MTIIASPSCSTTAAAGVVSNGVGFVLVGVDGSAPAAPEVEDGDFCGEVVSTTGSAAAFFSSSCFSSPPGTSFVAVVAAAAASAPLAPVFPDCAPVPKSISCACLPSEAGMHGNIKLRKPAQKERFGFLPFCPLVPLTGMLRALALVEGVAFVSDDGGGDVDEGLDFLDLRVPVGTSEDVDGAPTGSTPSSLTADGSADEVGAACAGESCFS